jgi:hypothetical protein
MLNTLAQTSSLFTAPVIAGVAAAAVSIPIVIHLLWRVRRQRQVWAAMRFLEQAIKKQKNKLKLEHLLLLLARCLILLLLGLGLAGPVGAGLSRLFATHAGHKLVHVVIDDTLTSQTLTRIGANHTRLDDLKATARKLVEQMGPEDHLAIWRSATQAMPLQGPTLLNKPQAMQLIDSIKPRHSAGDLPGVLAAIQTQLDDAAYNGYEQVVVLLSDYSHGSLGTQAGQSFDRLAREATVCLATPTTPVPNVLISKVQPRRSQLLRPLEGPVAVMLDVTLSREGKIDQPATTTVRLLLDGQNAAVREHHWSAGQSQATVQMDMSWAGQSAAFPLILPIEAKISTDDDLDRLAGDNRRWTQVRLRDQLRIMLIDENPGGDVTDKNFAPSDWLAFALSPDANNLNVQRMLPAQLTGDALADMDVCMVLRPDRLSQQQMAVVDQWTRAGGLLWVFAPTQTSLPMWAYNLAQQMQLPIRLDVKTLTGDWGLSLTNRPPSALSLLGADWQALLRPVRVTQSLAMFNPANLADHSEVWLKLADETQTPILISQEVGDGQVLLCSLALSADWSNVQTRPLFVPLLHESIASLSSRSAQRRLLTTVPGMSPLLGERFAGSTQLIGPKRLMLKATDTGKLTTTQPLDEPGVYRAEKDGANHLLLVNIDPAAASLAMSDEHAVRQMLFEQSPETALHWLDRDNPTWPTRDVTSNSQLGRNLLWLALALLILETLLARWFSHAGTEQRSWAGWIGHSLVKLLHLDHLHPRKFSHGKTGKEGNS